MKHYATVKNGYMLDRVRPKARRFVGPKPKSVAKAKRGYRHRERIQLKRMTAAEIEVELMEPEPDKLAMAERKARVAYWEAEHKLNDLYALDMMLMDFDVDEGEWRYRDDVHDRAIIRMNEQIEKAEGERYLAQKEWERLTDELHHRWWEAA